MNWQFTHASKGSMRWNVNDTSSIAFVAIKTSRCPPRKRVFLFFITFSFSFIPLEILFRRLHLYRIDAIAFSMIDETLKRKQK